jgi:multicomponent Na+:H+ antiporter subunit D
MLVWPIILPFATAAATAFLRGNRAWQQAVSITAAALHLAVCCGLLASVVRNGISALQVGNWPAPFGITLVADHLSAAMTVVTALIGLATVVYSKVDIDAVLQAAGYHPLLQILIGGICGAFLTGDIFNLYVWFEVMLMASFGLLVLTQQKRPLDGGVKYVVLNLFSTLLFITGLGMLYGLTGTLNMADLHLKVQAAESSGLLTAVAVIFMVAFGIKSGIFPLFFWLPASYHTPPVAVSAIFAGLLTKVGVYALIRMFTLVFTLDVGYTHTLLLISAGFTMVTGVLGAAAFDEFRRILSFHIISQVGYMVLGLALYTPLALAGAVFYLIHHMIVKANLFFVSGIVSRRQGSFELGRLGGLYRSSPLVATLFFIPAFSLAGFPPLSGFWAKMLLIRASLETGQVAVAALAAAVGLLTAYSMTKIWAEVFWKPAPGASERGVEKSRPAIPVCLLAPVAALALVTLAIGLAAEPVFRIAQQASHELMTPELYVQAVLGASR